MKFLSAGHHSKDPGAINKHGVKEADLTMELRDMIAAALTVRKERYILDKDHETLGQYIGRIEPGTGSVLCDLHFNSFNGIAGGVEVIVKHGANADERALGTEICQLISKTCGIPNRGVKPETQSHRGKLGILHTAAGIAVLIEVCFIDNEVDMKNYQAKKFVLANGIAELLIKYDKKHS